MFLVLNGHKVVTRGQFLLPSYFLPNPPPILFIHLSIHLFIDLSIPWSYRATHPILYQTRTHSNSEANLQIYKLLLKDELNKNLVLLNRYATIMIRLPIV